MNQIHDINNARVLVTGGSGFIGTNIMQYFISNEIEARNFDINPPINSEHSSLWEEVDIVNFDLLKSKIANYEPTHILHLGAATGMDVKDISFFAANIDGVENIIKCAEEIKSIKQIVFTSSLLVCRLGYLPKHDTDYCPPNLYGKSKMMGEKIVRGLKSPSFSWTIVRPTMVWGPWFWFSTKRTFFMLIDKGLYWHPKSKPLVKPMTYVGNTVFMMTNCLFGPVERVNGKTFYLADYPKHTIQEWANNIQFNLQKKVIKTVPIWLLRLVAYIGDLIKFVRLPEPPLTSFRLNNILTEGDYPIADIQELCQKLPYSLDDGVKATAQWLYKRGDISTMPVDENATFED